MSQLKIYRASAGSGKTYTLTKEFLFLLFDDPYQYKQTLAVTFTNKATGEMKSRILEKLFEISVAKTDDYVDELQQHFKIAESEVRKRAEVLLSYLLHDFSNFSVSTIDSFFQKIIRSFAREAGLESGFKIELNATKILQKAIDHLLMKIDLPENIYLKNWLVQFAEQKLSQGKSWNLSNDLNKLGNEIFNELFQLESRDILISISNKDKMQAYIKDMHSLIHTFEEQIKKIGDEGSRIIREAGLMYEDFTGKSRSPLKFFEKLKKIENIDVHTSVTKLFDNPEKWGRKDNPPATNEAIEGIFPILNKLLKEVINYIQVNFEPYNTAKTISQNHFALGIIADIATEAQQICRDENIFLIADSSLFLNRIIDENDAPFIYEKIGNKYLNFMIDEFQDTSKLQWFNFKPLLGNSLSSDKVSLIVGDVKQSIYRWRNSDWNLLNQQISEDFVQFGSNNQTLDKNWRSNSLVIKFNNTVFKSSAIYLQSEFNNLISTHEIDPDVKQDFEHKIIQAYSDVHQEIPESNQEEKGYIKCKFYEPEEDISYNNQMLTDLVENIESTISQGYHYNDLCILVRKKGEGEIVANALLSGNYHANQKKIPVVSNESLFLSGSTALNFIISQIKFLQNPDNLILKAEMILLKNLFSSQSTDIQTEIGQFFHTDKQQPLYNYDAEWITELKSKKQKPLLELIEFLAHTLPKEVKKEQGIFIQAFINSTNQFIKDQYPDISAFIDWWDEKGKTEAISIPDEQDAIKIMTIHKSKGLEFKAVFIPFCNWKLDTEIKSNIIWCKPNSKPFDQVPLLPVTYTSRLMKTIFKEDYFQERLYQFVDSINMLYVAFTRACEVLFTYSATPSKSSKNGIKSVSDLMHFCFSNHQLFDAEQSFIDMGTHWDAEQNIFECGDFSKLQPKHKKDQNIESHQLKTFENQLLKKDSIAIKSDSSAYFSEDLSKSKINYGTIMHEAFENILKPEDIDVALNKMEFEGKIMENEKDTIAQKIKQYISKPEVTKWFNSDNLIRTENTILTPYGAYRPDRVLYLNDTIEVIDYKFGDKPEKKYEKQILQYIRLIKSIENKSVKGYIWYVTLDEIVQVSPETIQGSIFD